MKSPYHRILLTENKKKDDEMTTILIRTVIIYVFLLSIMRLMGKRQLGELEVSELVSTLLLSDIAALPITNQSIPLVYAIIPILTITAFEVGMSLLLAKVPSIKNLLSTRPSILIRRGLIDRRELSKNRISIDELLSELRQKDITDISEVAYAIIEQNGKISVIPKRRYAQPNCDDLSLKVTECGICHLLVSDGRLDKHGLACTGKSEEWVRRTLNRQNTSIDKVFIMTLDDAGKVNIIKKSGVIQ